MKATTQPAPGEIVHREIRQELERILHYWSLYAPDRERGGFAGRVNNLNQVSPGAPKGAVLHARILWTFAAAYGLTRDPAHLQLAADAFRYIRDHFNDPVHGGLFWSVDADGRALDTHKQIYAQAFGIYGMSEYYRASGCEEALALAKEWFRLIERYSLDTRYGGYIDAFARDWSLLEDKRLSAKDSNAVKTMNTHLHVIEGYANLYELWPDPLLAGRIRELLAIFQDRIMNKSNHHLELFFNEAWTPELGLISYGHDIEAGWLLQSCAASIADGYWTAKTKANALLITDAALEGLDEDGGLWYELNTRTGILVREKHWWPQAEALVGFCNAWQISGNPRYREAMLHNWAFIRQYILDWENGEWFWGVHGDHSVMQDRDKIGLWKCPYHNSRACLQLVKRLAPGT
jgi:mannobiose 2-epimerase